MSYHMAVFHLTAKTTYKKVKYVKGELTKSHKCTSILNFKSTIYCTTLTHIPSAGPWHRPYRRSPVVGSQTWVKRNWHWSCKLSQICQNTLELLSFLLKEVYPNMWVALRIAVTIPVTVAATERSFSKLKTYLRSTMPRASQWACFNKGKS